MGTYKDLTGQKFGRLTVIKDVGRDKWGSVRWECVCECGGVVTVPRYKLWSGYTKSCGCLNKDSIQIGAKKTEQNYFLSQLKYNAKKRGYPVTASDEELLRLAENNCAYCGVPPKRHDGAKRKNKGKSKHKGYNTDPSYYDAEPWYANGIDRVDNSRGYEPGNIVACCETCNRAKLEKSAADFIAHCRMVVEHQLTKVVQLPPPNQPRQHDVPEDGEVEELGMVG